MGDGTVLRRDKVVARSLALICLLMFVGFGAASIAYLQGWSADKPAIFRWLAYFFVPFSAYVGLTKTVLRTVVTTREVHVQQGLRGLRIPTSAITSCRVNGPERVTGGTHLYSPAGAKGILIGWRGERGKELKALIGSEDPAALVASIERARQSDEAKVRVAPSSALEPTDEHVPAEASDEEPKHDAKQHP